MDTDDSQIDPVTKKGRRIWKKAEEDCLIRVMRNEYSDIWQAENGFKAGFLTKCDSELQKLLPHANIKAHPHIDSKVKVWKLAYNKITDVLRISGFSWNDVTKSIVVDDDSIWEEYVKAQPNCKGLNRKPFPYYDDWCILFGKDRATGELAEDPSQMAESNAPIDLESDTPAADDGYIPYFTPEHGGGSSHGGGSENGSIPRASTPTSYPRSSTPLVTSPPANAGVAKKGKKRSRFDESAIETLDTFCKASVEHMGEMVKVMGYAKELSALRKLVPDEVEKLELSEEEKFRLVAIISKAEERVDTFFGTREEKKLRWAQMVLQGKVYPLNE